jgi:hypothetical protein
MFLNIVPDLLLFLASSEAIPAGKDASPSLHPNKEGQFILTATTGAFLARFVL